MIRAVLDTNVLISAIASPSGVPGLIFDAWERDDFELITSRYILDELLDVLSRPYFAARAWSHREDVRLARIQHVATDVPVTIIVKGVAPDPADDAILATAASASAGCLVTGDKPLLALGRFGETALVSPRALLDLLLAPLL